MDERADLGQPGISGGGQPQGLLGGGAQLVAQDGEQAVTFGAVVGRVAGVGEDQLAQQRADGEDGRGAQTDRVVVGGVAAPAVGALADATSLRTALVPLIVLPALGGLLLRGLREPAPVRPSAPRLPVR